MPRNPEPLAPRALSSEPPRDRWSVLGVKDLLAACQLRGARAFLATRPNHRVGVELTDLLQSIDETSASESIATVLCIGPVLILVEHRA